MPGEFSLRYKILTTFCTLKTLFNIMCLGVSSEDIFSGKALATFFTSKWQIAFRNLFTLINVKVQVFFLFEDLGTMTAG